MELTTLIQWVLILLSLAATIGLLVEYSRGLRSSKYKSFNKTRRRFELIKCFEYLPFALGLWLLQGGNIAVLLGFITVFLGLGISRWIGQKKKQYLFDDSKDLESTAVCYGITGIIKSILDFCRADEVLKKKRTLTYNLETDWTVVKGDVNRDVIQITWKRGHDHTPLCNISNSGKVHFYDNSWADVELPRVGGQHTQKKMIDLAFDISIALKILDSDDIDYVKTGMREYLDEVIGHLSAD